MAEFEIDKIKLEYYLDKAIMSWTNFLHKKVKKVVPRDWDRPPNPIRFKKKAIPERNIRKWNKHYYRNPVQKWWAYYEWVTGNLWRSVWIENTSYLEWSVWVEEWPTEDYAYTQEYWDSSRNIPARSFLKKTREDYKNEILKQVSTTFAEFINKS